MKCVNAYTTSGREGYHKNYNPDDCVDPYLVTVFCIIYLFTSNNNIQASSGSFDQVGQRLEIGHLKAWYKQIALSSLC